MDQERRKRIEDLFADALEQPPSELERFLAAECAGDADLRAEVEAMLAAHRLAEAALDRPVTHLAGGPAAERRIGPYRLLSELGRGGMGVVYLAERDDGQFRRRVAIKLVRSAVDDGQIHRRFQAERQILASLSHPHIAQLLDGGVTDGQLPYLVMEYVEGLPITDYCDTHRLGITARLRLFQQVCSAVHHAHQNLVIHRDLKPSNIVVDGRGEVKLLDFGIAKLLNPALGPAAAPFTRLDQWVMTPDYASPEQVRGEPQSTASDVYALGVILYELVTGRRPYYLTTRSPEQILELICERDPERPSTRVGQTEIVTFENGTTREITPALVAAARDTPVERLQRQLRGDLDAIVMTALRKEPARRYGSAEMLSQDLQRHLEGLPVQAHSGSRGYRARKFLRRHRLAAAAAAVVVCALVGGTAVASWQAAVARRERSRAEAALAQAEQLTDFLMGLFDSGDEMVPPGEDVTARELLRRGADHAHQLADQPAVRARMLDVIGRMHHRLGRFEDARQLLEHAVAIRRTVPGHQSLDLAESLIHLAWVHRSRADLDRARSLVQEALAIRREALPGDHPDLAEAVHELGWLASGEEQERLYREAFAMLEQTNALPERRVTLLQGISTNLRRQGRFTEALETDREALRLAEQEFGPAHFLTGQAMIHLADHVRDTENDHAEAERLYRRGLELIARRYGENDIRLIHGLHSLAELSARRRDHVEAERLYRRAMGIFTAAAGRDHPSVAQEMRLVARELERQGRLKEAEALARDALDHIERALGPRHPQTAMTMASLGSILLRQGRSDEADVLYARAIEIRDASQEARGIGGAELRRDYGRALIAQRRYELAERQLLESLAALSDAYDSTDHPNVVETRRALVELYESWGRQELVERYEVPAGAIVR